MITELELLINLEAKLLGTWHSEKKETIYRFNPVDEYFIGTLYITHHNEPKTTTCVYKIFLRNGEVKLQIDKADYTIETVSENEILLKGHNGTHQLLQKSTK